MITFCCCPNTSAPLRDPPLPAQVVCSQPQALPVSLPVLSALPTLSGRDSPVDFRVFQNSGTGFSGMPAEIIEKIGSSLPTDHDVLNLAATSRHIRQGLSYVLDAIRLKREIRSMESAWPLMQAMDAIENAAPAWRATLWRTALARLAPIGCREAAQVFEHARRLMVRTNTPARLPEMTELLIEHIHFLAPAAQSSQSLALLETWRTTASQGEYDADRYQARHILEDVNHIIVQQHYLEYINAIAAFPHSVQHTLTVALPEANIKRLPPLQRATELKLLLQAGSALHFSAQTVLMPRFYWETYALAPEERDEIRETIHKCWDHGPQDISPSLMAAAAVPQSL